MTVLWVDEDCVSFPSLRRKIDRDVGAVHCAYSIVEAIDWLEDNQDSVSCLLLDAIMLLGLAGGEAVKPETAKWLGEHAPASWPYHGSLVLKRFEELACRTVVLSIADEATLRNEGFGLAKHIFWKGNLGSGVDELIEKMNEATKGGEESSA